MPTINISFHHMKTPLTEQNSIIFLCLAVEQLSSLALNEIINKSDRFWLTNETNAISHIHGQ